MKGKTLITHQVITGVRTVTTYVRFGAGVKAHMSLQMRTYFCAEVTAVIVTGELPVVILGSRVLVFLFVPGRIKMLHNLVNFFQNDCFLLNTQLNAEKREI